MAKKIVYGKEEDEYNLIKPYLEELKKVYPGTKIAVGMDGDHHLMLVGWGICSPENKDEWKIFQEGLKQQYGAELLEQTIFFFTDRQKGSLESFPQVFNGEYAALQLHHNTNHIENNLLSQFKCGDVPREQFHKAVNSFTRTDKLKHMGEIRKISRAAAEYLEAIDQKLLF